MPVLNIARERVEATETDRYHVPNIESMQHPTVAARCHTSNCLSKKIQDAAWHFKRGLTKESPLLGNETTHGSAPGVESNRILTPSISKTRTKLLSPVMMAGGPEQGRYDLNAELDPNETERRGEISSIVGREELDGEAKILLTRGKGHQSGMGSTDHFRAGLFELHVREDAKAAYAAENGAHDGDYDVDRATLDDEGHGPLGCMRSNACRPENAAAEKIQALWRCFVCRCTLKTILRNILQNALRKLGGGRMSQV